MNRPREAPFGDVLRRYRNGVRLTQKALAHKARISVQSISALERGINRAPHRDTILALASALELSARDRSLLESAARRPSSQAAVSTMLTPTVPLAPFVGRCHELAKIDRALMADGPVMLAVAGEPGIGKSRLLAEAAERAIPLGWVVLGVAVLDDAGRSRSLRSWGRWRAIRDAARPASAAPAWRAAPGWRISCLSWRRVCPRRCPPRSCRPRKSGG